MKSPLVRYSVIGSLIWLTMFFGSLLLVKLKAITNYDYSAIIGYSGMILSLAMIFFALKDQRDRVNGGYLSGAQGFMLGMLITLIVATVVGLSDVLYISVINPAFYTEYMEAMKTKWLAEGKSVEQVTAMIQKANTESAFFMSPVGAFLLMFATVLPIGLLISLVSAALLRRTGQTS